MRPTGASRRGCSVFLGLFLLVAGAAGLHAQSTASRIEVASLAFDGNVAFSDDSLRFAIVNRETECRPLMELLCWMGVDFGDKREYLIRRELPADVARLRIYYSERGYREARVDTTLTYEPEEPSTRITFHIDEGEPVRIASLDFVGGDVLGAPLLANLPLAEGDPLSIIRLEETRDSLLARLRNQGYAHADVFLQRFIPQEGPRSAQVTYEIDTGPLTRIGEVTVRVSGEAELDEGVVREMLPFQPGSYYSGADLLQGHRNLFNLEIVRNALIEVDSARLRTSPDTLVPLIVEVGTGTLHRVRLGGGWNMADCFSAEGRWTNRNVFGEAQRLQVSARISNLFAEGLYRAGCQHAGVGDFGGLNWTVSTELNLPFVFSPRNSFTTSVFWERQSLPDVFIRQAIGLNLVMTRAFRARMPLVLSYRPQRTGLEAAGIFFCTSLLVCNPEDISVLEDPHWLSPLGIAVSRDRTDILLNPSEGYLVHAEVEHASSLTGSDFAYTRLTGDVTRYLELARRTVVAGRLRVGWIGAAEFGQVDRSGIDIIHPQKRFFAGGANSVRGFPQNRMGPRVLTVSSSDLLGPARALNGDTVLVGPCTPGQIVDFTCDAGPLGDSVFTPRPTGGTRLLEGNLEYRFAVSLDFQGVTFLDFGQVWSERGKFDLGDLEWTPGVGARYFSPIGPLRMDVAYRFKGGESLPVVTSRLRPFGLGDDPEDRVRVNLVDAQGELVRDDEGAVRTVQVPWLSREELALLAPSIRFGDDLGFFRRLQIHLSIGQAF